LGRGRVLANANSREFRDTGRASRVRISIRSTGDLALLLPTVAKIARRGVRAHHPLIRFAKQSVDA